MISDNVKSCIIGLWRQGNPTEYIATFVELPNYEVVLIISNYKAKLKRYELDLPPINLN